MPVTFYQDTRNRSSFMVVGDGATIMAGLLSLSNARYMLSEAREMLAKAEADLIEARKPYVPTRGTGMASLDRLCAEFGRKSHEGWAETCEQRVTRLRDVVAKRVVQVARMKAEAAAWPQYRGM
jgi:hypothetical protein